MWRSFGMTRGVRRCEECASGRGTMFQNLAEASLSDWGSFYVITGSAAAALTGLQFVVMALVNDTSRRSSTESIDAFGTPNIVHFCAVLLVSAAMSAPW